MKKITILTKGADIPNLSQKAIGLLFECATDSKIRMQYPDAILVDQLIGDKENTIKIACHLALKILDQEPYFRGVPHLTIFKEVVCVELHKIFHLLHLHDYLINNSYDVCEFISASWWADELYKLVQLTGSCLQVNKPELPKDGKFKKLWKRIISSQFSFKMLSAELIEALHQIDKFHRFSMMMGWLSNVKYDKNKIWFYSTAVNYTHIGLAYESYFPSQLNFLIENKYTGGKPLTRIKRRFFPLYAFALPSFIPSREEIKISAETIRQHVESIPLNIDESKARKMLLEGSWLATFFAKLLPYGLFSSSIFENWLRIAQPSAVIVGNQVFEGYALYKATEIGVPTVLLQHGVMSDYYRYLDYPIDHYVVRGRFFYERLSLDSQKRTQLLNLPEKKYPKKQKSKNNSIIFFTSPLYLRFVNADIYPILLELIKAIRNSEVKLIIHVHPLERISDYQNIITNIGNVFQLPISYSQGGDIHSLLSQAAAVITFGSTVFLDCLYYDVPIICFNWVDMGFMKSLKSYQFFYFTDSLSEFHQYIIQSIHGKLPARIENKKFILSETTEEEIKTKLKYLIDIPKTRELKYQIA